MSQNDTPLEDTSVVMTRGQLAIFLARKLLEDSRARAQRGFQIRVPVSRSVEKKEPPKP